MQPRARQPVSMRSAFSLMEVLMAIFILGIGVISIAAIFPAGIAQQRQATDDAMGPQVADNALSIIRTHVKPEYFGTLEMFQPGYVSPTIVGDWPWQRPAFYPAAHTVSVNGTNYTIKPGSISIFAPAAPFVPALDWAPSDRMPWNTAIFGTANPTPPIVITQRERYYPMETEYPHVFIPNPPKPQYVWDCMFRRFQGKILVAIFVYRVNVGGQSIAYSVASNPESDVPPLPVSIDLIATPPPAKPWHNQPWFAAGDETTADYQGVPDGRIPGTFPGDDYDPLDQQEAWQITGQWLLDQNNNIHRVINGRRQATDGPVELARPVPPLPNQSVYFSASSVENTVTNFWYIPPVDLNGVNLTPVYVTVREL